jgi:hypothetical protein
VLIARAALPSARPIEPTTAPAEDAKRELKLGPREPPNTTPSSCGAAAAGDARIATA